MKCPMDNLEGREQLLNYVSGSLETDASAALESHLEGCAECKRFTAQQKAVWDALDVFEPAEISADFNRRLYQRIEQPITWRERLASPIRALQFWHGLPVAAAAAAALLVGGLVWQRPSVKPRHETPSALSAQVDALQPEQLESALDDMEMLRDLSQVMQPAESHKM